MKHILAHSLIQKMTSFIPHCENLCDCSRKHLCSLQWRHNERDCVSNRHWPLWGEPVNSLHKGPVTRKIFCIWWRHHVHITWQYCKTGDYTQFEGRQQRGSIVKVIIIKEKYRFVELILSAAYMRQWIRSALIQIMACRLFGVKP